MGIEFFAITLDFLGKVLIGITALLVHKKVKKEKRIDEKVLREMKLEQKIGFLGIILVVIGYILHLYSL